MSREDSLGEDLAQERQRDPPRSQASGPIESKAHAERVGGIETPRWQGASAKRVRSDGETTQRRSQTRIGRGVRALRVGSARAAPLAHATGGVGARGTTMARTIGAGEPRLLPMLGYMARRPLALLTLLTLGTGAGCGVAPGMPDADARRDASLDARSDAGITDRDADAPDSEAPDSLVLDSEAPDAPSLDSEAPDSETLDSETLDSAALDSVGPDASSRDAPADGRPDSTTPPDARPDGSMGADASSTVPNTPPVARGESFTTAVDTVVRVTDVRGNDSDDEGNALTATIVTMPAHGTLTPVSNGVFDYRPSAGFVGADSFVYQIDDGRGGIDTATVHLYVARRVFYVASDGDDTRAGTSPTTAWRTLMKVQSTGFSPGDAVLFRRGDTFRGSLQVYSSSAGTADRPVVFSSYGTGAMPRFAGSELVTGWTRVAGRTGVWQASTTGPVSNVYVNGVRQTLARFPNTGYLRTDVALAGTPYNSTTRVIDAALTQPAGYWNGASVRVRVFNWAYDTAVIASSTPGRLELATAIGREPAARATDPDDWGYFIDNKFEELDREGEWYFDARAGRLYVYPPGGADPNGMAIEVPRQAQGLVLFAPYTIADGFEIYHYGTDIRANHRAVGMDEPGHDMTLRHCVVRDSMKGILAYVVTPTTVTHAVRIEENTVRNTQGNGVFVEGRGSIIERNELRDIATIAGYGEPQWGSIGLNVTGANTVVRHNVLDRIGYMGIAAYGSGGLPAASDRHNVLIEENVVRRAVAILNDGGAMGPENMNGGTFRRNLVLDTVGDLEAVSTTQVGNYRIAFGIYFGNRYTSRVVLEGNVAVNNTSGVHVDHTMNSVANVVRGNTFFANVEQQATYSDWSNTADGTPEARACMRMGYADVFEDNLLVSTAPSQRLLYLLESHCPAPIQWWGSFDRNRYYSPYLNTVVRRWVQMAGATPPYGGMIDYTLAQWRSDSGQDARSSTWPAALAMPRTPPEIYLNPRRGTAVFALAAARRTLDGAVVSGTVTVPPFSAVVLVP